MTKLRDVQRIAAGDYDDITAIACAVVGLGVALDRIDELEALLRGVVEAEEEELKHGGHTFLDTGKIAKALLRSV